MGMASGILKNFNAKFKNVNISVSKMHSKFLNCSLKKVRDLTLMALF
jgi:hypothetical protein